MIKINLKQSDKGKSSFLAGIDITRVNLKLVLLFSLLSLLLDIFISPFLSSSRDELNAQVASLKKQDQDYVKKLGSLKQLEEELINLKEEEQNMLSRISVVQQVISIRNNPMKIMYYIAQNIPEDVWINELIIDGNSMIIKGNAVEYKSIGSFLDNLKRSIFFDQQVNLEDYKTVQLADAKTRVEEFKINAKVARFE